MTTKTFSLILWLAWLSAACVNGNAQNISALYTTKHKATQVNEYSNDSLISSNVYKVNIPLFVYAYDYTSHSSYFTLIKGPGKITTTITTRASSKPTQHVIDFPSKEMIYKNLLQHTMQVNTTNSNGKQQYNTAFNAYKWKLGKERKSILGYTCRKATCTYNNLHITAWYANQIKISDGPLKFWGLPGLILEVEVDAYYETTATCIEVTINQ